MTTNNSPAATAANAATKNGGAPKRSKRRMARQPKSEDEKDQGEAKAPVAAEKTAAAGRAGELTASAPRGPSKIAAVIALLQRTEGATLPEMIEATGWLPHTTRAALTGLKKKNHVITKDKRGEVTCYHIAASA